MAAHAFHTDFPFPTLIEAGGDIGASAEDWAEAELDMRFDDYIFVGELLFDFAPVVGEAAGIDEDDAVFDDAEVLEVGVGGEEAELPALLAEVEEAVEPGFDLIVGSLLGQLIEALVEGAFDAFGGVIDAEPEGPALDADAGFGEGDVAGHERGAGEVIAGKRFAALVLIAIAFPDRADVGGVPEAIGDDFHDQLCEDAEDADAARWTLEEMTAEADGEETLPAAEEPPEDDEGDDLGIGADAFDDPVGGGVDDFADTFAEAGEGVRMQLTWSILENASTARSLAIAGPGHDACSLARLYTRDGRKPREKRGGLKAGV